MPRFPFCLTYLVSLQSALQTIPTCKYFAFINFAKKLHEKYVYCRFHPKTWHKRIGMRAAVIGCRHAGDCGPGFMRVNAGSSCGKPKKIAWAKFFEVPIIKKFLSQAQSHWFLLLQSPIKLLTTRLGWMTSGTTGKNGAMVTPLWQWMASSTPRSQTALSWTTTMSNNQSGW